MENTNVTQLLRHVRHGDPRALETLVPLIYDSLRKLATKMMHGERDNHTMQATAVVNECYLQLINMDVDWQDRGHFFAIASRQMRRYLVDYARAKNCKKRGGELKRQTLDDVLVVEPALDADILDLDTALSRLAEFDSRKCQAIELHYFGGLTHTEISQALDISPATVDRELRLAKAWLYRELEGQNHRQEE